MPPIYSTCHPCPPPPCLTLSASPLHVLFVFLFTLLTLFVRFPCQSALNIVALLLQFAATVMLVSHGQVGSRQAGISGSGEGRGGHSISVIDIGALCILSIAYQSLVYQPSKQLTRTYRLCFNLSGRGIMNNDSR